MNKVELLASLAPLGAHPSDRAMHWQFFLFGYDPLIHQPRLAGARERIQSAVAGDLLALLKEKTSAYRNAAE